MSIADEPMKQYRAIYRGPTGRDFDLNMYARDAAHAAMSAKELIPSDATLIRVLHDPDWN